MQRRPVMFGCAMLTAALAVALLTAHHRPAAARAAGWIPSSVNGMHYEVLLPANYNANTRYPVILYLHQLVMGNYPAELLKQVNQWFDTAEFRTRHPCIIVVPMLDQTSDTSGQKINFGGKQSDNGGEENAIAALRQVLNHYPTDPTRIYITGNSMGGMGTWQMLLDYNSRTGQKGRIFAAGLPLAGRHATANPATAAKTLQTVPIWAIHGQNDQEVSPDWDRQMAKLMNGNTNFRYTEVQAAGHEVWDTYYTKPEVWDWLFSQNAANRHAAS
jgi:predicted peptidase